MAYPVVDTFSDASGTHLAGSGTTGSRTSDSGSSTGIYSGTITAYDIYEVNAVGEVYNKTSGAGAGYILYGDNAGAIHSTTATGVFNCYTTSGTSFFSLLVHKYIELRYTISTHTFGVYDRNTQALVANVTSGTSTYTGTTLSFGGSAGTKVANTIAFTLSGTNPSGTGLTVSVAVNGTTISGWSFPTFTSGYPSTNYYNTGDVGWALSGQSVGTASSQTGVTLDSFNGNDATVTATGFSITGPAVTGIGLTSPSNLSVRSLVGGTEGGCYSVTLTPVNGVLASSASFTFTDDAGTGVFGTCTIAAGNNTAFFTYKGLTSGSRTITGAGGGGASSMTNATFGTYVSPNVIIIDGDSRSDYRSNNTTSTIYSNNLVVPAVLMQSRLSTKAAIYNVSVAGQSVESEITNIAANITTPTAACIAAGGNVIVIHWGAGNSVAGRSTASGHTTDTTTQVGDYIAGIVQSYCTTARTAGAKVIIVTDSRRRNTTEGVSSTSGNYAFWRGLSDTTNFNLVIDEFNAQVYANWTTYADGIFDWGSDYRSLNPTVTGGILADGTHFNPFNSTTVDTSHVTAVGQTDWAEGALAVYRGIKNGMGVASAGGATYYAF